MPPYWPLYLLGNFYIKKCPDSPTIPQCIKGLHVEGHPLARFMHVRSCSNQKKGHTQARHGS